MNVKLITLLVLIFSLSLGCKNFKKEKKQAPGTGVENVNDYTNPIENDYNSDVAFDDTTQANTGLSEDVDYSSYQSDTADEAENALPEDLNSNVSENTNNENTSENETSSSATASSSTHDYSVFYIVGGSFKDINKANRLNAQFNKEGVQSYVASPVNGFNRVIIGKYYRKADALKDLTTMRRKYKKLRFWLLGGN